MSAALLMVREDLKLPVWDSGRIEPWVPFISEENVCGKENVRASDFFALLGMLISSYKVYLYSLEGGRTGGHTAFPFSPV